MFDRFSTRSDHDSEGKWRSWIVIISIVLTVPLIGVFLIPGILNRKGSNSIHETVTGVQPEVSNQQLEAYTNSINMKFVRVPAGKFEMGSDNSDNDEKPKHEVTISSPYWIQTTEVTQAQWKSVMKTNPSRFKGDDLPVEIVSWDDCRAFIRKLNVRERTGKYRLPTEAEWEYACRAGRAGTEPKDIDGEAWYHYNSQNKTNPVAMKKANPWGVFDMLGNVWEWCEDWYGNEYYKSSPAIDARGPESGQFRVCRGGSWNNYADGIRYTYRFALNPHRPFGNVGFRCVKSD